MRVQTKRNMLRAATAAAVLCTAAIVFTPAQAAAADAAATAAVNVRAGPGTSFAVIDSLRAGERVDVLGCRSGWCYVDQSSGPDGYVSANYLRNVSSGSTFQPEFNLSFNFPNNGGSFSIGTGGVTIGIGPQPSAREDEVCFYSGANYTGRSFCLEEGESVANLRGYWNDEISSIRNADRLRVTVCEDAFYRDCRTYTTSVRFLGSLDDEISSIRVR